MAGLTHGVRACRYLVKVDAVVYDLGIKSLAKCPFLYGLADRKEFVKFGVFVADTGNVVYGANDGGSILNTNEPSYTFHVHVDHVGLNLVQEQVEPYYGERILAPDLTALDSIW